MSEDARGIEPCLARWLEEALAAYPGGRDAAAGFVAWLEAGVGVPARPGHLEYGDDQGCYSPSWVDARSVAAYLCPEPWDFEWGEEAVADALASCGARGPEGSAPTCADLLGAWAGEWSDLGADLDLDVRPEALERVLGKLGTDGESLKAAMEEVAARRAGAAGGGMAAEAARARSLAGRAPQAAPSLGK